MDLKSLIERRVFLLENKDFEYEIVDPIDPRFIPVPYQDEVRKHQEHDQSSHGSWATGELSGEQKAVVLAWTSLSNKSSWRQIANDLSEGKTPNASENDIKTVKTLVDAIKQNGVIPTEALGRAELLTTGLRWQGALPKVGDTLKNELSSATLDEKTSERFSQYSDFGGSKGKPVIFHYGMQTKGLDVNRAGADAFADEQEWLVSGTFKITDRYSENGITHLNLKPVEAVKKHGTHDQKDHGNWARGNFNEETEGEDAQNAYFERYGIKTDGSKEPVGISRDEIKSLNDYTADGYAKINGYLRRFDRNPNEEDSIDAQQFRQILEYKVTDLDKLIEEAPELFGDKNLYRVFDKNVLDTLKEGDVLTDKGFMSTTRVDITSEEGFDVLQNLQMIRTTDDRASIILPSKSKTGKGLAVDYVKNAVSDLFDNVSTAANEKEVLLPRNTSLKFMGLKKINARTDNAMDIAVFQRMDK